RVEEGRGRGIQVLGRGRRPERALQEGRRDHQGLQPVDDQGRPALPLRLRAVITRFVRPPFWRPVPVFKHDQPGWRANMMAGKLSFDQLKSAVSANEIDTVLVAAVDMQGRLIGKRFLASFFVESGYDETHGCNYLLADDIDMEPVPGYKAASWSQGYGDFVL